MVDGIPYTFIKPFNALTVPLFFKKNGILFIIRLQISLDISFSDIAVELERTDPVTSVPKAYFDKLTKSLPSFIVHPKDFPTEYSKSLEVPSDKLSLLSKISVTPFIYVQIPSKC